MFIAWKYVSRSNVCVEYPLNNFATDSYQITILFIYSKNYLWLMKFLYRSQIKINASVAIKSIKFYCLSFKCHLMPQNFVFKTTVFLSTLDMKIRQRIGLAKSEDKRNVRIWGFWKYGRDFCAVIWSIFCWSFDALCILVHPTVPYRRRCCRRKTICFLHSAWSALVNFFFNGANTWAMMFDVWVCFYINALVSPFPFF